MDEKKDLTKISKNNKKRIDKKPQTVREIVDFLEHEAMYRNFPYMISELYEGENVEERLRKGWCEITGKKDEQIRKNVQNWLNGKNTPHNREKLFQICFALGLDEEKSSRLLGTFSDHKIHYRNPSELAYAFALRTGRSYQEAVRLKEETLRIYEEEIALHQDKIRKIQEKRQDNLQYKVKQSKIEEDLLYTNRNKELFEDVVSEEDYFSFIREKSVYLGTQHETAYAKFMELLDLLQTGEEKSYSMKPEKHDDAALTVPKDRKYSLSQIEEDYLRMNVPKISENTLQKIVSKYWPNATMLNNMKNRKIEVTRKTLILLYMATENFDVTEKNGEEFFYCDEDLKPEELYKQRCDQMDLFLNRYGMNPLDYGNPFDLIICYAMYPALPDEEEEFVAERIEKVMEILYEEISENED